MAVTDETKDCLEQVKKGKARKFVLLTKGPDIVSLIVYKKGAVSKFVKQAKAEGTGLPCFGVITGKGMDINFQLAVTDGFDKAPVKTLVLKKYLEEEAEFKCKPLFEIVENSAIVLDEDDPLHARFLKLQKAALEACDKYPDSAEKIGTLCRQTGALLDDARTDQATDKLEELEGLLGDLAGTSQGAGGPTGGDTAGGDKTAADKSAADKTTADNTTADKSAADPQEEGFDKLRKKLEPLLLVAQKTAPDKATPLGNVWNFADAKATAGLFAEANKALVGLAEAIKNILAAPPNTDAQRFGIRAGLVAEMVNKFEKARLSWDVGIRGAMSEMKKVRDGLRDEDPELAAALADVIQGYRDELDALLAAGRKLQDDAAAENQRRLALAAATQLKKEVMTDDLLAFLDTFQYAQVKLQAVMGAALAEVEQQLAPVS